MLICCEYFASLHGLKINLATCAKMQLIKFSAYAAGSSTPHLAFLIVVHFDNVFSSDLNHSEDIPVMSKGRDMLTKFN